MLAADAAGVAVAAAAAAGLRVGRPSRRRRCRSLRVGPEPPIVPPGPATVPAHSVAGAIVASDRRSRARRWCPRSSGRSPTEIDAPADVGACLKTIVVVAGTVSFEKVQMPTPRSRWKPMPFSTLRVVGAAFAMRTTVPAPSLISPLSALKTSSACRADRRLGQAGVHEVARHRRRRRRAAPGSRRPRGVAAERRTSWCRSRCRRRCRSAACAPVHVASPGVHDGAEVRPLAGRRRRRRRPCRRRRPRPCRRRRPTLPGLNEQPREPRSQPKQCVFHGRILPKSSSRRRTRKPAVDRAGARRSRARPRRR